MPRRLTDHKGYATCLSGAALQEGDPKRCVQPVTHKFVARDRKGSYIMGLACDFHYDLLVEFEEGEQSLRRERLS